MGYRIENIITHQSAACREDRWRGLLEAARGNGWDSEGTSYDFAYEVDEAYDDMADYLYNLWMIFHVSREMFEWDGNYIEKKGQVISESDAYRLMQSLEQSAGPDDRGLLDVLNSGPVRILDE